MNLYTAPDPKDVRRIDAEPVNARKNRVPLYAARKKVFPKRAEGRFRRFKWIVMLITLGIYYLSPWIRWDRGPYAPDQAILLDLSTRRFFFFFIEIWPQEFYYVAGLLVMAGFGLFLVTSAVGRAWCGYACPQTVWVDLFLVVERAIEGDRNARMKLDAGAWTLEKIRKRILKHAIWLMIGVATGGAWIFYFADAPTLVVSFVTGSAPAVAYATVATLAATTYVLGGLMREQVCTYMCPWPRIQGAMLDENSLVVTYNDWRGEQRSRHAKKAQALGQSVGDCVDCNACVAVCPMGIDIRDGQQMECITCALCIDACDGVMDKLGKPRGLIAYATLSEYAGNMSIATDGGMKPVQPAKVRNPDGSFVDGVRHFDWRIIFRPRILFYATVWSLIGIAMVVHLSMRGRLELNVVHDRNPQYVLESDGSIRNGYTLRVLNMVPAPRKIELKISGLEGATMRIPELGKSEARTFTIDAAPDVATTLKVFVTNRTGADVIDEFLFTVEDSEHADRATYRAAFNSPGAAR
ncbi:cytochrome c oxidase accessory protein CcoG [Rhizobium ruizarguesonis]|uniref:cytochrome c oxidase accessory protein CcoG n=1 Tax=Rhizobium leguminosarum TaxID=384 RepID=UPI00103A5B89|nr:cytochrome c oxidase accessory protein CcoG [Rhizobium leguminosarum]MBY5494368.1 cytochrome c oxidase accessory protein CcoG [Rhizobium leguminosarum]TBZ40353.1 cytochrome c oxidase accessory protein CcoG [Rhizobium leguminosarum bv. viciae]TCA08920.1 cytochrome c oxidase accessory protein CcoG [Rhizobium leguminosarum bv. viciae]TCA19537.1 cytochrome c oxidase accessory protein CcoG [Rhizobium leguminosarum bv. viciae]